MSDQEGRVFVVMGVSGSGKTTVGEALAAHLNCRFYDGDDFHPEANVAKMAAGIPLNDSDRVPWLARLAALIQEHLNRDEPAVLASSALKQRYRDQLRVNDRVLFIFLDGDYELIWERMQVRADHYMKPEMLASQFEALEPPGRDEAIVVPIDRGVDEIVTKILQQISIY